MKLKKTVSGKPSLTKLKTVKNLVKEDKSLVSEPTPKYTDLRSVVDFDRPLSIMYSGVEEEKNFNILYDMGIRNFLISYFYIQRKHMNVSEYSNKGIKFFVDSGAYSFIMSGEEKTINEWEKYIQSYLKWIERHKDIVFAFANLDIEYLVGGDQVQKWNEQYFEPFMLRTGIPVCFVHHGSDTNLSWEQYCQRYPYVGISWGGADMQGNDVAYGLEKLRTAEKYNTVVHGMAMTKTALLTKLPFYTVDSTTWLVGLQYGEINFWTGTKMSRLKKDKWQGPMLQVLVDKGFNEEKLLEEDMEEMIRVNVFAFIEAEKFIHDRLKASMYWMKPKSTKRKEEDLASINYPDVSWIMSTEEQDKTWKTYAADMNVTQEDIELSVAAIIDITCFMNWDNPDYSEYISKTYTPELIKELHDIYINRIVSSDDERIVDLQKFYKDCLLGENDKLLLLGTNFDRIMKERDSYVTDEEYDIEDVSDMEINNTLSKYLPAPKEGSPAPEISDLDDEIFREEGIIPVRDSHGKFIKGQRQVARPKKLYSEKYPKLACDLCINAQKCPEYKAGYVCAYNKMFSRYNTRDMGDVIQAMQGIADFSMQRLQRGMLAEVMNGGLPDPSVSQMMNQTMGLLSQLQKMYEYGNQEVIRQTKVLRADGTQEMTTQVSNPQSGGILEKIFGNMQQEEPDTKEVLEAEVIEEES